MKYYDTIIKMYFGLNFVNEIKIIISSSTALLTSIAILITFEYISKLEIKFSKLRDWVNVNTLLNEKTLKNSMDDTKIDEKEAEELRKFL